MTNAPFTPAPRRLSSFLTTELAARAGLETGSAGPDPLITGLQYDSRAVEPGNLFFALPGLHTDGRAFAAQAASRGASVIVHEGPPPEGLPRESGPLCLRAASSRLAMSPLADAFFGRPSQALRVIGVTGTEGKSTIVYLISQLLTLAGERAGFISTVSLGDGLAERPNPEHQTTPEAPVVHAYLARIAANRARFAVIEASSHGLSERTGRLADVRFAAGLASNVHHEHLEFHGTWEQYRADKASLFRRARDFCVLNAADPSAPYFLEQARSPVFLYMGGVGEGIQVPSPKSQVPL
ncbi:MAG: Mur ligase domain-containing protein, partial [Treponema sp.]|nr:Mur ligase domain-containing protein [Treponema sp.]